MKTSLAVAGVAALAFVAGAATSRQSLPAAAQPAPLAPQLISVTSLTPDDFASPPPGGTLRSKTFVTADGATVAVQIGTIFKHYHADANEVQYVVEGTGREWLGDGMRDIKPGDMLIIPKGTPHGGTVETSGHLKIIAIKTPPQASTDTHRL